MTAREYLTLLGQQWRWIVGAALVGVVVAGVAVLLTPASYAASVTFYVSTASNTSSADAYQGSLLSQDRVKSYTELLSGYRLGEEVVTDLRLPDDPQSVADQVSASVSPNTVLLEARVTDASPERAQAIAGAVGRRFPALIADLERPADRTQPPTVSARVVEGPVLAPGPVSPKPLVDLGLGLAAGLLIGVTIAVVRRSLDRSVLSLAQLAKLLPHPLLGTLPRDRHTDRTPLFLRDRPMSPAAESLRAVHGNLARPDGEGVRVVVVTSAVEGEGKSTLVVNLALAEANAGGRVLLVEADLRRPRASAYLGVPAGGGLAGLLAGQGALDEAVRPGGVVRLDVLPSGPLPPNPYELVESARMDAVLAEARERYDLVLVDAPPVLPVADGLALARRADSVVVVVRAGATRGALVRRAHELLVTAGVSEVGVVFNGVTTAVEGQYAGRYLTTPAPTPAPAPAPQLPAAVAPLAAVEQRPAGPAAPSVPAPRAVASHHRRPRHAPPRQQATGGQHRTPTQGIAVGDLVGRLAARGSRTADPRPPQERSS
ncbi:polysaccharide biosynthesis tyrosine autokinase [Actinomycetospora corticicola]|uniref:non-specific protein-tyrosine kinase n=1 Tax=Actinomycetospora corticicola TaxID=663602 RepID=A0A7Y9DSH6_9PSEU|nr:capsular exopolysaccharide synthesis family protein [Actinomycetospora corticicola]